MNLKRTCQALLTVAAVLGFSAVGQAWTVSNSSKIVRPIGADRYLLAIVTSYSSWGGAQGYEVGWIKRYTNAGVGSPGGNTWSGVFGYCFNGDGTSWGMTQSDLVAPSTRLTQATARCHASVPFGYPEYAYGTVASDGYTSFAYTP